MKARGNWILLRPESTDTATKAGLIMDDKTLRFRQGVVVSSPIDEIKNLSKVIYDISNSHETMIDNNNYLITRIADIAIIL